jgi:hypothetical protein
MLRIATASALLWPWLRIGLLPPVESIRMSDHSIPVLINTEATLVMGMLSSELPKKRGLIRKTRSGLTSMRVGKRKLPRVQRLALKTLLAVDVKGAVDMPLFYRELLGMTGLNVLWQDYLLLLPAMPSSCADSG